MDLVSKVRQTVKTLINASKNMKLSREVDVFNELAFNFSMESTDYSTQRQMGTFTIQYLISPKQDSTNTAPSITYDQIISAFDAGKAQAFKNAGLILVSYSYEQSDILVDPTTGSVSLTFGINIQVTERTRT